MANLRTYDVHEKEGGRENDQSKQPVTNRPYVQGIFCIQVKDKAAAGRRLNMKRRSNDWAEKI